MPESLDDIKKRVQQKLITPNFSKAIVLNPDEVSQYDNKFIIPLESDWREARQEDMAQEQPGIDQLANGVLKGASLAATTFADTFGGTVFGIANSIINGSEQGYFNAFVNNPFSNSMQDINEKMESIFTNYRSKAEQEAGLLDQMFDWDKAANFWGDMFIKNMGFAGGAMAAGMVSGKLFSALGRTFAQKKEVELFNKMTKSIAAGEAKSIDGAIKILQQAPELVETSASEIKSLLEQGARISRNWNRVNQIASSTLSATGEARIEALGNGRQFYQTNKQALDSEYIDPSTGQVKVGKELEYQNKLASLDKSVKGFQNAEFLWNTVLLTASNFAGYRDMFAKNYSLNAKRFSDSIKINALKDIQAGGEVAMAIKPKWYNTLGKVAASSNREGMEEFFQGVVQKSAEDFYTGKFKGTNEGSISDMINSVGNGLTKSLNQEGLTNYVLGALTGLVMPGANVYNAFKDADVENQEAQERAGNINKAFSEYVAELKQDPTRTIINFQEMINRSMNLDQAQQKALLEGDKYNYESLKNEKFYNLANAYIKAGKVEELTNMLQDETKLSVDDIRNKYAVPNDPQDPSKGKKDFFKNWTDTEVSQYIRKQASTNLAAIEDLKQVTEDLEDMFGEQIALVTEGDKTKQVAIKDILNRSLYLGKTLDKRINDLHQELSKLISTETQSQNLDTGDGFAITNFVSQLPQSNEKITKEGYDRILNNFETALDKTFKKKELVEKLKDYVQLVNERKAHNSAFIRLTKNDFTDLLNTLNKLDSKATTQGEAEVAKSDPINSELVKKKEQEIEKLDNTSPTYEEEVSAVEEKYNNQVVNTLPTTDEESQENTTNVEPKLVTKGKSNAELESNSLSDYPFYTTNKTVEYDKTARGSNRFETSYDSEGYPILNSNQDAIDWNTFLETNSAYINPKNYIIKAFQLSSDNIPQDIKDRASKTIKEGFEKDGKTAKQEDYDNAIIITLIDLKNGELVKQDNKNIYTFLPLASSLYSDTNLTKVNLKALLRYYTNNNNVTIEDSSNLFSEDLTSLIKVNDKFYTPLQLKEILIDFARTKYKESLEEIKNSLQGKNQIDKVFIGNYKQDPTFDLRKGDYFEDAIIEYVDKISVGSRKGEIGVIRYRETKDSKLISVDARNISSPVYRNIQVNKKKQEVYIPLVGVSNGILLTRGAGKDSDGNRISPMSPVSEVLRVKRDIDTKTKQGLENVEVAIVTTNKRFTIGGTSIINAKKGSTIIFNKNTKEYFYANSRNLNNDDIEVVLHLLDIVKENSGKPLSEIKVNVGGNNKFYYMSPNNQARVYEIPIFAKNGQMSLMNNILFWGQGKDKTSKHTVYLQDNRIYFSNPNGNFVITSIGLDEIRNPELNQDFLKFLKNKRFNPNKNMMNTIGFYTHPKVVEGKLEWKVYPNGYKDFLFNSENPVLITNAVNSNSKYNGNKILFASKNVILDSSNNGKPTILNSISKPKTYEVAGPSINNLENKKADIERRRQEELRPYDERDAKSLEAITPNNPNHPTIKVGMKVSKGLNVIVEKTNTDNWNGEGEGYTIITAVKSPAKFDSNGKMTKAAKVEIAIFNSKEEAEAAVQATFEKVKSLAGKKQKEINAKYDAELAALEETSGVSGSALKDVEGKKADIERRRQEAFEQITSPEDFKELGLEQNKDELPYSTTLNAGDENLEETLFADSKEKLIDKINAKYDAELATLEIKKESIPTESPFDVNEAMDDADYYAGFGEDTYDTGNAMNGEDLFKPTVVTNIPVVEEITPEELKTIDETCVVGKPKRTIKTRNKRPE